jgi:hypothetical protein
MKICAATIALLLALVVTTAGESSPTTKGNLVGTWVKHHTQVEDHGYPADANWQLEASFSADGTFVWRSTRTEPGAQAGKPTQESVTGKYVKEGYLITYRFKDPSEAMLKELPQFFAFWPLQLRGQQTLSFRDGFLCLGNDGGKTWIFLTRKETQTVEPPAGDGKPAPQP